KAKSNALKAINLFLFICVTLLRVNSSISTFRVVTLDIFIKFLIHEFKDASMKSEPVLIDYSGSQREMMIFNNISFDV
ncbi:MAG: hypothetical protein ACW990_18745, partial [Promethearchaeota archaeon]